MKLLHIDSSILGGHSVSRDLSARVVRRLRDGTAGGVTEVVSRDLAATPLPHFALANLPTDHPLSSGQPGSPEGRAESQAVLDEFLAADIVVIGAPMYNFTISSQLKAWVDRIVIPGRTFRYGPAGPEGLAGGKRVIAAIARGGFYGQGSPAAAAEHLETYLRTVFGFLGITDIEVILAEGIAAGPDQRASAVERAGEAVRELRAA